MLIPDFVVLIVSFCLMISNTMSIEQGLKKRSAASYAVEGCYSSFASASSKQMGGHNSNVRCQDTCRDLGFIFAATKEDKCQCGNIYPKGHKVSDNQCSSRCRSWSGCSSVQSCCGGPSAYTVSVVGNIDVAKQVLRRLSHAWLTNTAFRNYLKKHLTISSPQREVANWWHSLDRSGWSLCGSGKYMTGLWRNNYHSGDERLGRIEEAECYDAPKYLYPAKDDMDCYNHNWWHSFDRKGWSTCNNGYYMTGIFKTNGGKLYNLEEAKCCRPRSQVKQWGNCYHLNVWASFDRKGWNKCAYGYYMVGLWRNSCERLGCIEEFKCCKMGAYNGHSWVEKPDFRIKVQDTSGQLKQCSMNAMDKSASSSTYKCKSVSDRKNMLALNAISFNIEDKTPLNVAQPKPIPGFRPVICSAHPSPYKCTKWLTTAISTSSTFKIGTGLSIAVKVGASVEVSAQLLGVGTKTTFTTEVTAASSFNVERSSTKTYTTTDKTDVSVQVPSNTEIMINMLRTVQDIEYKWKGVFRLLGKYSTKWKNGFETLDDVTTVLSGSKREIYAYGSWKYPGTDLLRVVITDKYGNKKSSGCQHKPGKGGICKIN